MHLVEHPDSIDRHTGEISVFPGEFVAHVSLSRDLAACAPCEATHLAALRAKLRACQFSGHAIGTSFRTAKGASAGHALARCACCLLAVCSMLFAADIGLSYLWFICCHITDTLHERLTARIVVAFAVADEATVFVALAVPAMKAASAALDVLAALAALATPTEAALAIASLQLESL